MPPLKHLAIIMDGNGRWARSRGLERSEGHRAGTETSVTFYKGRIGDGGKRMTDLSERYHKTFSISWEQLQNDCRALAGKLLRVRKDWSRIVAIARGGLVPAAIIARELDIRVVDTVCISSYTLRTQGGVERAQAA